MSSSSSPVASASYVSPTRSDRDSPSLLSESVSPPLTVSPTIVSRSKLPIGVVQIISIRVIIGAIWLWSIALGLSFSTVMHGIATFLLNAFTCIGLFGILVIIVVPIAYVIHPETVIHFKFGSLGPIIAIRITNGLDMLDCLVYRAVRRYTTTTTKHSTQ